MHNTFGYYLSCKVFSVPWDFLESKAESYHLHINCIRNSLTNNLRHIIHSLKKCSSKRRPVVLHNTFGYYLSCKVFSVPWDFLESKAESYHLHINCIRNSLTNNLRHIIHSVKKCSSKRRPEVLHNTFGYYLGCEVVFVPWDFLEGDAEPLLRDSCTVPRTCVNKIDAGLGRF